MGVYYNRDDDETMTRMMVTITRILGMTLMATITSVMMAMANAVLVGVLALVVISAVDNQIWDHNGKI